MAASNQQQLARRGGGLDVYDAIVDGNLARLAKLVNRQRELLDLNERFWQARKDLHLSVCPLHLATYMQHVHIVRYLLGKMCCSLGVTTANGRTALHVAVTRFNTECFHLLLSRGANADPRDVFGNTPLHYAAESGQCDVIDVLLATSVDVNSQDMSLKTPLMKAVRAGQVKAATRLLECGSDVTITDENEEIALHFAARSLWQSNPIGPGRSNPLLDILIAAGSDVNKQNATGRTPLLEAIYYNDGVATRMLLEAGCDVNLRERNSGDTALHVAVRKNDSQLTSLLIEKYHAHDVYNSLGELPVHRAIINNTIEVIDIFLRNNFQLDVPLLRTDITKKYAVQIAFERGHLDLLRLFDQLGFTMNDLSPTSDIMPTLAVQKFLSQLETVPQLRTTCRKAIRRSLGKKLDEAVPVLPLPTYLKDYLLLRDLEDLLKTSRVKLTGSGCQQ